MPEELRRQIEENDVIPPEWAARGYHWCLDWDFMLVGPSDPEAVCCFCRVEVAE